MRGPKDTLLFKGTTKVICKKLLTQKTRLVSWSTVERRATRWEGRVERLRRLQTIAQARLGAGLGCVRSLVPIAHLVGVTLTVRAKVEPGVRNGEGEGQG